MPYTWTTYFLVADNEQILADFKTDLEQVFDLTYFGLVSEHLGIELDRTTNGYSLSQRKYTIGRV